MPREAYRLALELLNLSQLRAEIIEIRPFVAAVLQIQSHNKLSLI